MTSLQFERIRFFSISKESKRFWKSLKAIDERKFDFLYLESSWERTRWNREPYFFEKTETGGNQPKIFVVENVMLVEYSSC